MDQFTLVHLGIRQSHLPPAYMQSSTALQMQDMLFSLGWRNCCIVTLSSGSGTGSSSSTSNSTSNSNSNSNSTETKFICNSSHLRRSVATFRTERSILYISSDGTAASSDPPAFMDRFMDQFHSQLSQPQIQITSPDAEPFITLSGWLLEYPFVFLPTAVPNPTIQDPVIVSLSLMGGEVLAFSVPGAVLARGEDWEKKLRQKFQNRVEQGLVQVKVVREAGVRALVL